MLQDCNLQNISRADAGDLWSGRWADYDYYDYYITYPQCDTCEY